MIGKLKKLPLRDIWKNEARDFTTWLAENIDTLNEALEVNYSVTEKEKSVGSFSLDIMAENEDGQIVIIENQLEKTDHDHLGKVVTYLSNLEAKTAIWITGHPRDEHKKAVEWLNEITPDDVAFYLVKVEAVQIESSVAAPLFSVIAEPNETSKEIGKEKKEYAERHHLRKEFWSELLDKAKAKTSMYNNISPSIYSWIGTGAGKSGIGFNVVVTNNYSSAEVYLDRGKDYPALNKERFDQLVKHKAQIEKAFGSKLLWERLDKKRACRISKKFDGAGLKDRDKWPQMQDKLIDSAIRLAKALKPYIIKLKN